MALPAAFLASTFELLIAILAVLSGVSLVLSRGAATPGAIEALLPEWVVLGWAASMTVGGALILTGILAPPLHAVEALPNVWVMIGQRWKVEQAGLILLGCAGIAYALCIFTIGGLPGLFAGCVVTVVAAALLVREQVITYIVCENAGRPHPRLIRYLTRG